MEENISSASNENPALHCKCDIGGEGLYLATKLLLSELTETDALKVVSEVVPIKQPEFHTCEVEHMLSQCGKEVSKENIDAVVKCLNTWNIALEESITESWWNFVSRAVGALNLPDADEKEGRNEM
jgi:hypothetical protein